MKKSITWRNFLNLIFIVVVAGLLFVFCLKSPTDPDMGWHLRDGEVFWTTKSIPKLDQFSHTMADFPVVAHEWLTDIGMYLVYKEMGLFVLSLIFALITATAFYLATLALPGRTVYRLIAAVLGVLASQPIIGVRPQMITLLFLAVLLNILLRYKRAPDSKIIFWLPPLFLVWTNLHGGFSFGLITLGIFGLIELIKTILKSKTRLIKSPAFSAKQWLKLAVIGLGCVGATLINPYLWRIYIEVYYTIFDPINRGNIRGYIAEWLPVTAANPMSYQYFNYIILFIILVVFYLRKVEFTYFLINLVFVVISLSSWRNMPLLMIVSLPLWVVVVEDLAGQTLLKLITHPVVLVGLVGLTIFAVHKTITEEVWPRTRSVEALVAGSYPYDAVQYVKANPPQGQMLNEYNWGGFLIWQLPQHKTFIDGRMPPWRMPNRPILLDWKEIDWLAPDWEQRLGKYQVNWAFLRHDSPLAYNLVMSKGWQVEYQDDVAWILVKP